MTTSWTLEPGYQSSEYDQVDVFKAIKEVAEDIIQNRSDEWEREAIFFGAPEYPDGESLRDFIEIYTAEEWNPFVIHESSDMPHLFISASAGGESREAKEAVARAFCSLLIREIHAKKMNISMTCA